jgi:hypothetical protein
MDYFNKIQKLLSMQELSKRRLEQLELEVDMDKKLIKNYKKCPQITFNFVMAMRRLNRNYSSDVYDSSIFDYPDKIKNNLDIADSLYLEYFTNPTCENLSKFLEK